MGSVVGLGAVQVGGSVGAGGEAEVFACTVAGMAKDTDWLFKRYTTPTRPDLDAMRELVQWPSTLATKDQQIIAESCAWPAAVVTETTDPTVVGGVIIAKAPDAFYLNTPTPNSDNRLKEIQYLILANRSQKLGVTLPDHTETLAILEHLTRALTVFDTHNIVHGDISMRNILFATNPPRCFVLDCDSATLNNNPAGFAAVTTPGWTDPRILNNEISRPDLQSDRYALAAAIYRTYYRAAGSDLEHIDYTNLNTIAPTSKPLTSLLTQAFTTNERPPPQHWQTPLQHLRTGDTTPQTPAFTRTPAKPTNRNASDATPTYHHNDTLEVDLVTQPTQPTSTKPAPTTQPPPTPTNRTRYLVAGLAALLVGVVALFAVLNRDATTTATATLGDQDTDQAVVVRDSPEPASADEDGQSESVPPATEVPSTAVQPTAVPATATPAPTAAPVLVNPAIAEGSAGFRRVNVDMFACRHVVATEATRVGDGVLLFHDTPDVPPWWIELSQSDRGRWSHRRVLGVDLAVLNTVGQVELSEALVAIGDEVVVVSPNGASSIALVIAFTSDGIQLTQPTAPPPGSIALTESGGLIGPVGFAKGAAVIIDRVGPQSGTAVVTECGAPPVGSTTSAGWQGVKAASTKGLLTMQRLSDAFSSSDWVTARSIDRARAGYSDSQMFEGWGALNESVILPFELLRETGNVQRWRLGLLGHETWRGSRVSTLFCVTWEVNVATGNVVQLPSESEAIRTLDNPIPGWSPFSELADQLRFVC